MFTIRSILFFTLAIFCWGTSASAQMFTTQHQQTPPTTQQRVQQTPIQQQPYQVQPIQTQPVQTQPMQTQPIHQVQHQTQPMGQPAAPHGQIGMNVSQPNMGQPNMGQPIHTAATPGTQPFPGQQPMMQPMPQPTGQSISLYGSPSSTSPPPMTIQPGTGSTAPPGMQHMGRAEPVNRIVPFFLEPNEQRELDEFLARWERYSTNIKRYDVEFYMFEYDPTNPDAVPNQALRTSFGHFKYNSNPLRFLYVIEGEWRNGQRMKRDGDKNPHIFAEKIIIDEKTVFKYDYNAKTVHRINIPPERIGEGIANSPLPLIFGAKAEELKRRFSMKVEHRQDGFTVVYARPLLMEDQQEFRELEIMLERDLRARGLRQYDINGKGYKVFDLRGTKINPIISNFIQDIRDFFTPDTPNGWKLEEHHWTQQAPPTHTASPHGVPLFRGQ